MDDAGLDRLAAAIAVEEAEARGEPLELEALVRQLDDFARGVRMPPVCPLPEAIARINLHLFDGEGFSPAEEDYGHPESSLLDRVLQRRRGLPILLCVVYMEVARRVGVTLEGVGFPGHFLVSPRDAEPRFFLDPYHRGRVLDTARLRAQLDRLRRRPIGLPELQLALRPVDTRHIQIRMNNNLKGAYLRNDDIDGAIRSSVRMLAVEPHLQGEQRELALMRVHQGRAHEAIDGLQRYLEAFPDAPERADLLALCEELRSSRRTG